MLIFLRLWVGGGGVAQGFEESAKKLSEDYKVVKAKYDEENPKVCAVRDPGCQRGGRDPVCQRGWRGFSRERRAEAEEVCMCVGGGD